MVREAFNSVVRCCTIIASGPFSAMVRYAHHHDAKKHVFQGIIIICLAQLRHIIRRDITAQPLIQNMHIRNLGAPDHENLRIIDCNNIAGILFHHFQCLIRQQSKIRSIALLMLFQQIFHFSCNTMTAFRQLFVHNTAHTAVPVTGRNGKKCQVPVMRVPGKETKSRHIHIVFDQNRNVIALCQKTFQVKIRIDAAGQIQTSMVRDTAHTDADTVIFFMTARRRIQNIAQIFHRWHFTTVSSTSGIP